MARQSFMWTALPNGYAPGGTSLRVSVLLSPRLDPQADPKALGSFAPDWTDWPATLTSASVKVTLGGSSVSVPLTQTTGPNRVDLTYGGPDSVGLEGVVHERAVRAPVRLPGSVRPPGALVRHRDDGAASCSDLYAKLAAAADGNMPKVSDIVDDTRLVAARRHRCRDRSLRDRREQRTAEARAAVRRVRQDRPGVPGQVQSRRWRGFNCFTRRR